MSTHLKSTIMDVGHFIVTRFVAVELQPRSTKFNIVKYQSIWPFHPNHAVPVSNASSRGSSGIITATALPFFWATSLCWGRGLLGWLTLEPKQRGQIYSSFGLLVLFRYLFAILTAWPNAPGEDLGIPWRVKVLIVTSLRISRVNV